MEYSLATKSAVLADLATQGDADLGSGQKDDKGKKKLELERRRARNRKSQRKHNEKVKGLISSLEEENAKLTEEVQRFHLLLKQYQADAVKRENDESRRRRLSYPVMALPTEWCGVPAPRPDMDTKSGHSCLFEEEVWLGGPVEWLTG
jgi:hypothetical protein